MANISNFRPISLLTSFSKFFETIVFTRLLHCLNYNHILSDEQFGFRTKSSMELASNKLINEITSLNLWKVTGQEDINLEIRKRKFR